MTLYYILYIKIFSGGADCSGDVQAVAASHLQFHLSNQEKFGGDHSEARRGLEHKHHWAQHSNQHDDRQSPGDPNKACLAGSGDLHNQPEGQVENTGLNGTVEQN